ncbi:hypothetical protein [Okeania hirsuta]|uniref:hypothetical protein n=1 Tax=Okeania hirsuta TaxID=1458930 RepID=UPI000F52AF4F|nr:hypothetical protein [Okeania hirsuta]RQH08849.1 hypothetical protein D4Z78_29055 [Okeania hirsuta]
MGVSGTEIDLIGVPVTLNAEGDRIYQTVVAGDGGGGFDTLVGGNATDIFVLGESGQDFYNGIDSNVRISNFDPSVDIIQLGKENNSFTRNYSIGFAPGETDATIIARSTTGIGLAVVENVVDPFTGELLLDDSNFRFGSQNPPNDEPLPLEISFVEGEYLANNPGVAEAVNNGFIGSGLEHYLNFGINENRAALFGGTSSSDLVRPVGEENNFLEVTGVAVDYFFERDYLSDGLGEFDRLIGTPGVNEFILGTTTVITPVIIPVAVPFYLGEGEATIVDFNQFEGDSIELFKQSIDNIQLFPVGNDLVIEYQSLENNVIEVDTVAVIEGGANLNLTQNIETIDDFFGIDRVILF